MKTKIISVTLFYLNDPATYKESDTLISNPKVPLFDAFSQVIERAKYARLMLDLRCIYPTPGTQIPIMKLDREGSIFEITEKAIETNGIGNETVLYWVDPIDITRHGVLRRAFQFFKSVERYDAWTRFIDLNKLVTGSGNIDNPLVAREGTSPYKLFRLSTGVANNIDQPVFAKHHSKLHLISPRGFVNRVTRDRDGIIKVMDPLYIEDPLSNRYSSSIDTLQKMSQYLERLKS
jgi:hypothetical protein